MTRGAVVLLGPPASGKTSLANKLSARPEVDALRTGHLLTREMESGSALGRRVRNDVEEGRLAPTDCVVEVLSAAIARTKASVLVFDGFPRSAVQIQPFMELCRAAGLELQAVVVLMLAEEEVRRRLRGRRVCPRCGAAYHLEYDPPKVQGRCDQCGAALVQREDDHPEKVARRLGSYRELTVPVIEAFERDQPDCTRRVSGEASPESLLVTVTELFEKLGVLP